jgi:Gpi18-like mannosyltransferase
VTFGLGLNNPADRRNLKLLGSLFLGLAASVYAVGYAAWKVLGLAQGSPEALVHSVFDRWDVLNYIIISHDGYQNPHYIVWFPSLPLVERLGTQAGIAPWVTGTILVLACAALLTVAFYALSRLDFDATVSRDATVFLLVFPSSFFLFIPYTEAIFLLLAVSSFYFARTGKWPLACLAAGLAGGIRITGLFLGPALLVEYMQQKDWRWRDIRPDIVWLAITPAGTAAYMTYLWVKFDDALAFFHAERDFPRLESIQSRGGFHFLFSLIDQARVIITTPSLGEGVQNGAGLAGLLIFLVLFALMLRYRLRWSYVIFAALAGFSPLEVGRLESMNRYIIAAFPIFMVIGIVVGKYPRTRAPLICGCLALFFLSAVRFATYNWAG